MCGRAARAVEEDRGNKKKSRLRGERSCRFNNSLWKNKTAENELTLTLKQKSLQHLMWTKVSRIPHEHSWRAPSQTSSFDKPSPWSSSAQKLTWSLQWALPGLEEESWSAQKQKPTQFLCFPSAYKTNIFLLRGHFLLNTKCISRIFYIYLQKDLILGGNAV